MLPLFQQVRFGARHCSGWRELQQRTQVLAACCSTKLFCLALHSIAEKKPEKERVCLASRSLSQPIAVRSKDRNSRQERGRRKRRGETTVLTGLLPMSLSACLFYNSGLPTHIWPSHSRLGLLYLSTEKMHQRNACIPAWWRSLPK